MRLLLRGLWWRRGTTLALLVVAIVTTTAAALGPLYARAAGESILQDHLVAAGSSAGLHLSADLDIGDAHDYRAALHQTPVGGRLRGFPRMIAGFSTPSGCYECPGLRMQVQHRNPVPVYSTLTYRSGECRHLVIARGHCPTKPGQALASTRTVATGEYHFHLGATVDVDPLTTSDEPPGLPTPTVPPVRIVGLYRPQHPQGPYWFDEDYFDAHLGSEDAPDVVDALFVARSEMTSRPRYSYVQAYFDFPLDRGAVRLKDAAAVRAGVVALLKRHRGVASVGAESDLPKVLDQAGSERHEVDVGTLLVTLQLAVLAWLVLFQVVSDALAARGNEIAMAKLRGYGPWRTARFGLAEPLALLLLAIPVGVALALGIAHLFAAVVLVPGVPVVMTWSAVGAASIAFAGGVVATALAAYRILTSSVLDQWRRTERRPGHGRLMLAVDLVLAAGAVAALVALTRTHRTTGSHGTLALLAPAFLVFAVATVGVRLLPPSCRSIANRARATRRMGTFLAARQVSRRPTGLRLATLLAVAVGLATFGVAGETVAAANRTGRADAELGAPRVLSVQFDPRLDPVQATERADPHGRWAMAAATWLPDGGNSLNGTVVGIDAAREPAVGLPVPGGLSAQRLATLVGAATVGRVAVHTSRMRVHLTATGLRGDRRPAVQLDFRTADDPSVADEGGAIRAGTHSYVVPVGCRVRCLLRSITWDRPVLAEDTLSGTITMTGLDAYEHGRWHALPIGLGNRRAWYRLPPQGQANDHVTVTRTGVRDAFVNRNGGYGGIAFAADPSPLPVVATSRALIVGSIVPHPRRLIDDTQTAAPFTVVRKVHVLPQAGGYGAVAEVGYLEDELPDFAKEASWQVWVGADAPPDYRRLLTRSGLQITGQRLVSTRVQRLSRQAPALALLLLLVCALAGAVLAVGGTAISVSSSSRRRSFELAALGAVGVPRRSLLRAAILEQLFLLGAAAVLGVPTGLLAARLTMPIIPQFADRTPITLTNTPHLVPTLAFAAGFVVLLVITAVVAARALVRVSVPSRLRGSE